MRFLLGARDEFTIFLPLTLFLFVWLMCADVDSLTPTVVLVIITILAS